MKPERDASSIEPMWEGNEAESGQGVPKDDRPKGALGAAVRAAAGLSRGLAPHLFRWVAGMQPELRLSWGAWIYHLRRDGWVAVRRTGEGWDDNPRTNYNDRINRRKNRTTR